MLQVIGLIISLVIVLSLVAKRVNYGTALLIGSIILAIFSSLSLQNLIAVLMRTLTDYTTWNLVIITALISIFAFSMTETGMTEKLIENMRIIFPRRAILAILPALMGTLPMAGGALMSAPMIEKESNKLGLTGDEKSFINKWFRHWNLFAYPLAPAPILVSSLAGVALFTLIGIQILPLVLYLFIGYAFSIRKIKEERRGRSNGFWQTLHEILFNLLPILIAVFLSILGPSMLAALVLGVASIFFLKRVSPKRAVALMRRGFDWKPSFAIIGVMFFRYMIEECQVIEVIQPYVETSGLPTTFLLLLMALAIGFVTSMPLTTIAMVIPIATALSGSITPILTSTIYLTIVFSCIISPMDLSLILTVEYYKSRLQNVYRKLIPAALIWYLIFLSGTLLIQH